MESSAYKVQGSLATVQYPLKGEPVTTQTDFSVWVSGNCWMIYTEKPEGAPREALRHWMSYDGRCNYRLSFSRSIDDNFSTAQLPRDLYNSAATVWLASSSYPEFAATTTKLLWFALASGRYIHSCDRCRVPLFTQPADFLETCFDSKLAVSECAPQLPAGVIWIPSHERMAASVPTDGPRSRRNFIRLAYGVFEKRSGDYVVSAWEPFGSLQIPRKFEMRDLARYSGETQPRITYNGLVTSIAECDVQYFRPPELQPGTTVHDSRLGHYNAIYKSTERRWLSSDEAAQVGRVVLRKA